MSDKSTVSIRVDSRDYQLLKRILEKNGTTTSRWFRLQMLVYLDKHSWQLLDDPEIDLDSNELFIARRSNNENAIPWVWQTIQQIEEDPTKHEPKEVK